jgi:DNA transposition AAA+ family ATPase
MRIPTIKFKGKDVYRIGPTDRLLSALDALLAEDGEQRMLLISGEPGTGKTLAVHLWCSEHEHEAVYIDTPPAALLRTGRLLELLEESLGLPVRGQPTLYARCRAIITALTDSPRLIVFDEANRLARSDYLDLLRYIIDETPGAKVAFVSLPHLEHMFRVRRELRSRLFLRVALAPLTRDEAAQVLTDLAPPVIDEIHKVTGGHMRELFVLARHVRRLKADNQTPDMVRRIARRYTLAQVA